MARATNTWFWLESREGLMAVKTRSLVKMCTQICTLDKIVNMRTYAAKRRLNERSISECSFKIRDFIAKFENRYSALVVAICDYAAQRKRTQTQAHTREHTHMQRTCERCGQGEYTHATRALKHNAYTGTSARARETRTHVALHTGVCMRSLTLGVLCDACYARERARADADADKRAAYARDRWALVRSLGHIERVRKATVLTGEYAGDEYECWRVCDASARARADAECERMQQACMRRLVLAQEHGLTCIKAHVDVASDCVQWATYAWGRCEHGNALGHCYACSVGM